MHLKKKNRRGYLYRSVWVRKDLKNGIPHGYNKPILVGAISLDAESIPPKLDAELTDDERRYVLMKVIEPARQRVEAKRQEEARRRVDPNWRIADAVRLLNEAHELIEAMSPEELQPQVLDDLQNSFEFFADMRLPSSRNCPGPNSLEVALEAISRAAQSVREGEFGAATAYVKNTETNRLWLQVRAALLGDNRQSLMKALQDKRFVATR